MPKTDIGNYKKLGIRYFLALTAIAAAIILSQAYLQNYISRQEDDSMEINLSGRQRMLSQRIAKSALLLTHDSDPKSKQLQYEELLQSAEEWTTAHLALQNGNEQLGLKGIDSSVLKSMYAELQRDFEAILKGVSLLKVEYAKDVPSEAIAKEALSLILKHEKAFLETMDRIVDRYEQDALAGISNLKRIELGLLILALLLILLEVTFIFIPSAQMIGETVQHLAEEEAKAKKMALELSSLYETLEQSFQDLAEAESEVEDHTVYLKCDIDGKVNHVSERFSEIMGEQDGPDSFFEWLSEQGYSQTFIQPIQGLLRDGKTWSGEIKCLNEEGDFIWLKVDIIPILNAQQKVDELLVVGINDTQNKEAKAKSQEINREKLEKRLKEQQYRSVLILEGQEEERKRISREMHDGIGQYLTALKYSLDGITGNKSEQKRLEHARKLLGDVIKEVRRISFNLTPVALSDYGLAAVLNKFSEEMSKVSKIPVLFENKTGFIGRLEPKVENNLYRIVQEAVNNAAKYSEATFIEIAISHNSRYLHLQVKDNGKGFDFKNLQAEGRLSASGHGIFNIKERVNFINGQFDLDTQPGMGTTITIDYPLEQNTQK
jgi:two-component system, NarL family, sensor histidine kinase DegS